MDYYDIVVYWGYEQMDPVWSLLLMLRLWMSYGYTVIQVVYWVALRTKETMPDFCKNMDPNKWDTTVWYWVTRNPQEFCGLTCCQWDPRFFGCHVVNENGTY